LINFFRTHDETTAVVGKLQSSTFKGLAAYAGHGDIPVAKPAGAKGKAMPSKQPTKTPTTAAPPAPVHAAAAAKLQSTPGSVGLTVRIEINLPADGDQATYDRIFKSIRENLLNG
jgi:hypothetical protein